ncbi:MAG: hypothetical protein NVS9B2_27900 [Steroidobacteraceae bacterium]
MHDRAAMIAVFFAAGGSLLYLVSKRARRVAEYQAVDGSALDLAAPDLSFGLGFGAPIDAITYYSENAVSNLTGGGWVPPPAAAPYLKAIIDAEDRRGIPRNLLARQLYQESRFRPDARNAGSGALGIAQVLPSTARDPGFGVAPLADPLDPYASIDFAAAYLAALKRYLGTWPLALAGYNWGPGYVKRNPDHRETWPIETQRYVAQITGDVPVTA